VLVFISAAAKVRSRLIVLAVKVKAVPVPAAVISTTAELSLAATNVVCYVIAVVDTALAK
jgi:hypothetical protein